MRRYILLWCVAACGPDEPVSLDRDGDGSPAELDCDDADPARHPEAEERCDGLDNDCDLEIDDSPVDGIAGYEDADGDGFGAEPAVIVACELSPALTDLGGDCDDGSPEVKPGAEEVCDGLDNDCDPETPEAGLVTVGGQNASGLQEALDVAVSGDTVRLCDGTYAGSLRLPEIALTLESQNGPELTTLVGEGGPVLMAPGGEIVLRGLHLTGGVRDALTPAGGGLAVGDAFVTVEDCVFTDNHHGSGGAIGIQGGILTVRRTAFEENTAEDAQGDGGAILAIDTVVTIEECVFLRNRADGAGAVGAFSGAGAVISGTTFEGNVAGIEGGAVRLFTPHSEVVDSAFFDNVAETGAGGALASGQGLAVSDSTFEGNRAVVGGAASVSYGDFVFERVTLFGNAADYSGGALSVGDSVDMEILDSFVHQNQAERGGALDISQADDSTVISTGTDWGEGATDNLPADVYVDFEQHASFGAEDFTCETLPVRRCE